jgi:RibD C-terminal domain
MLDFAELWRAADKIVYSKTLETVSSARTRIERDFDPDAVRQLKATAKHDIGVGGPDVAAQAIKAGLVDELHLILAPVIVGGGKHALPGDVRLELELIDEHRFGNGMASRLPHQYVSAQRRATNTYSRLSSSSGCLSKLPKSASSSRPATSISPSHSFLVAHHNELVEPSSSSMSMRLSPTA